MTPARAVETFRAATRDCAVPRSAPHGHGLGRDRERVAWVHAHLLTETLVALGGEREVVCVPRGVFVGPDGRLHLRSDRECSRASTYQKVTLDATSVPCSECGHLRARGRAGFEVQEVLAGLAGLVEEDHFVRSARRTSLAARGVELLALEETCRNLLAAHPCTSDLPENLRPAGLEEVNRALLSDLAALSEEVEATWTSSEFRKALEEELTTRTGAPNPTLEGEQLVVVDVSHSWRSQEQAVIRSHRTREVGPYTVLLVPPALGALYAGAEPRHPRIEGPVEAPGDPRVLETLLALYDPGGWGPLSTLSGAAQAAGLV